MTSILSIRNLTVRFGGITALRDVSIDVATGETVLLVGANGAGKSSLINAIMGLVPVAAGAIEFAGADMNRLSSAQRAKLGIGYSPEGRRVFASMSVSDNVRVGGWCATKVDRRANYNWLMDAFPILKERQAQPAGQMSGGEQQVLALARAISSSPTLLLLDEPFLGLAPIWIGRVSEAIRALQQRGMTILMTEQMARPALKLATRGYVLRGGEVKRSGAISEIREIALAEEYL